jgi:hypothetical protein
MCCKGTCDRYIAKKPSSGGRYENGQKRCQVCEVFITWKGLWCPCCHYKLRGKPRNKVFKAKLAEAIKASESNDTLQVVNE